MPLIPKLRLITGVRYEYWEQDVDSFNQFDESTKETSSIGGHEFIPSANLVYSVAENSNIRLAYGRTVNRPDFIEASNFRYYDDLETGAIIKGNPDLDKAVIDHYDIRLEWFPGVGEVIALSGFLKRIESPIEAAINDTGGDQLYTYYNQESAENWGVEFEFRKNFGFIAKALEVLAFSVNYTYVKSSITLDPATGTNETDKDRSLQGQSPWVVNTGFFFDSKNSGTTASLLFNIFGRRITQVSTTTNAGHIYEESYPKLDFSLSQKLANVKLKLTVENILDPDIERTQDITGTEDTVRTYKKGIDVGLSASAVF
jgi:TonB-dependent receptor